MVPDETGPHQQDKDADQEADAAGSPQGEAAFVAVFLSLEGRSAAPGAGAAWAGGGVKLIAMIGAFLGLGALPLVLGVSAGLGVLTGLIKVWGQDPGARRQWRTISLPYGPFLAAGAWCYLFWGEKQLNLMSPGA
jgi:prepilin signal peptidase PulO-like enzyme (type II secretory pathway)